MRIRGGACAVASLAAALALTGCAAVDAPAPEPSATPTLQEGGVPSAAQTIALHDVEFFDRPLSVGDRLDVLVDMPDAEWDAETTDPAVLAVDDPGGPGDTRIVAVTAGAPGTATLVFRSDAGDVVERDVVVVP